ncbi:kelch-like protein 10 [Leptosomus discolor]|uniref:kelch-like protein 10 n=1 Tax=Leptosomus discolor TaxID=188344 RepID=UPI0005228CB8|nr:PREDICTED: kelch-like protein 10 [Leptosomus discolor]
MGDSLVPAGCSPARTEGNANPNTVYNQLRLEDELCDVTISVDGVELRAHKIILCGCSHYFRSLFSSQWSEVEQRVYKITSTSPEAMRLIIEYAYTRRVPVTAANVQSLLVAADQFNVMSITELCCEFLKSQLCSENCIRTWALTDTYYYPDLRQAAYMFILHHFEEVTKVSAEFVELSVNSLKDMIEKDELNVKREDTVCEAVLQWIAHDAQNRRQHVADLMGKVRLALTQAEYLMNIKAHDYVHDNEECKALLVDAQTEMYRLNRHGPSHSDFTNPLSRPRLPYTILFAIGGWSGENPTNAIETYDARADQWVNVPCEEEGPFAYHGTAHLQGFIYVIGGFDGVEYFSSVKRFDPLRKTWREVAPMHSRRCFISIAVLNDHIYAIGGFDGELRLGTAERYEPATNQWTLIAPMHEQRSDASATTLHEKVYVCGGFNGNERLTTAEVYDATTNQWTFIAPMSSRRGGVGVIAYGDEVYAVGGCDGVNRLRSAEAYNPMTNTWRAISTMFSPRSNFGIAVLEDLLFVAGGYNGLTTTFNVECYDRNTNEWYDVCDMGMHRSALSCCVVPALSNVRDYVPRRNGHTESSSKDT